MIFKSGPLLMRVECERDEGGLHMRKWILAFLLTPLFAVATAAIAQEWAYPPTPPPKPADNTVKRTLPGSTKQYTQAEIDDPFNPPDWFPEDHPPMPQVVAHGGQRPAGRACAQCHLTSGNGHPESSSLAGLPAAYTIRQMQAFKDGERKAGRTGVMIAMAKVLTEAEVKDAANYFASLKPAWATIRWSRPTRCRRPISEPAPCALRCRTAAPSRSASASSCCHRIRSGLRSRDSRIGFIDHVPVGSIAKGKALADGGDGKTVRCSICHGAELRGLGEVPGITGRPATYMYRQLNDMKIGNRTGPWVELMKQVVEKLNEEDMIALVAYLGSRDP